MTGKELLDTVEEWAREKNLAPKRTDDMIRAGNENGMVKFWLSEDMPDGWAVDGTGEHGSLMSDAVIDLLSKDNTEEKPSEPPKREGKMIPAKPPVPATTPVPVPVKPTTTAKPETAVKTVAKPKPATKPAVKSTPATNKRQPTSGGAANQLQVIQDKAAVPYKVRGGKDAPTAALAMRAFNESGGSLEELAHIHTENYIQVTFRGTLGNQSIDATQSVIKSEYLCTKAWNLINNRIDDNPDLILGVDPQTGFPQINPDATVKVRMNVDGSSLLKSRPATVWFWMELSSEWLFAARILQTQVKSIIARQLLNRDETPQEWRESREIEHENAEIDRIHNKR